ncbi:unnamed protein product [Malus baccata var. baccata]
MPVYPPQSPNPLINIYYPHYDEAVKNVMLKDDHFPSDLPGFGVNVILPWSNEINYVKHGSNGKQPCISDDSYHFDPIEICNVVHFDSDSDCTSIARTHHPQKSYKDVKECAACEYVGGQEHCDWMNQGHVSPCNTHEPSKYERSIPSTARLQERYIYLFEFNLKLPKRLTTK